MNLETRPQVKPLDWILVGRKRGPQAVVSEALHHRAKVVYVSPHSRAMVEWVVWREDHWAFEQAGPCSTYADMDATLREAVAKLRSGRRAGV